jgi:hypothetical protein
LRGSGYGPRRCRRRDDVVTLPRCPGTPPPQGPCSRACRVCSGTLRTVTRAPLTALSRVRWRICGDFGADVEAISFRRRRTRCCAKPTDAATQPARAAGADRRPLCASSAQPLVAPRYHNIRWLVLMNESVHASSVSGPCSNSLLSGHITTARHRGAGPCSEILTEPGSLMPRVADRRPNRSGPRC